MRKQPDVRELYKEIKDWWENHPEIESIDLQNGGVIPHRKNPSTVVSGFQSLPGAFGYGSLQTTKKRRKTTKKKRKKSKKKSFGKKHR
jgi:hypothetical protein